MKTINQHGNAGTTHRISGITFAGQLASKSSVTLYRVGTEIHELRGGVPIGPVSIKTYDEPIAGWGRMTGPFVQVLSADGHSIVIEAKDIPA